MPRCPKCGVPLCRVEIQGVPVHTCPDCRVELIEDLRLKAIERRGDPDWSDADKDAFCRLADQSNNLDEILCPRCSRIMRKFLFRNYANLQVDQCPECRCYWLDAGEMEKMQVLYQETRASFTEEDWVILEKRARTEMAMETRKTMLRNLPRPDGSGAAAAARSNSPAGTAAGALLGMVLLDRKMQRIDDEAEAIAGRTARGPEDPSATGRRSAWTQTRVVLLILLGAALVAAAVHLLWQG